MKKFFLGILAALLLIGQTMMAQEPGISTNSSIMLKSEACSLTLSPVLP